MDTSRVHIVYRPLRIAWAIKAGDFDAFRRIVKLSCTLVGGRYNPIVMVDDSEAAQIVECFRADAIKPVGNAPELAAFAKGFGHLIQPWFGSDDLHYSDGNSRGGCHVLDIYNLLTHWHCRPEWRGFVQAGIRRFVWDAADALGDALLVEHGAFPPVDDVHTDYAALLTDAARPDHVLDVAITSDLPIPEEAARYPALAVMGKFGVRRYPLSDYNSRHHPGFYVGQADDLEDLVALWNLGAANMQLHFIDRRFPDRYSATLPIQQEAMRQRINGLNDYDRHVAVWARDEPGEARTKEAIKIVGDAPPLICTLRGASWNGMNIKPPKMMLGEASSLGVVVSKQNRQAASFALPDKPFSGDVRFHMQKLVASVSMFRSRQDQDSTFQLPYVPELNEFFGPSTGPGYDDLRVEQNRLGVIINASADDQTVYAVPTLDLVENLFKVAGLKANLSNAGLITRQLITQMGGVDNTRVFKILGVRRLIRDSGLNKSVKRLAAISAINQPDQVTGAKFSDHKRLFIEARPNNRDLSAGDVFSHLVEKRIFRIGGDLVCPTCRLSIWVPLDDLKQNVDCTYCGAAMDTTRHFSVEPLTFRRSGLLGIEKNMLGAIPVTIVLQQLMNNIFHGGLKAGAVYMPSLTIDALDGSWPEPRETDFFAVELSPSESMGRERCTNVVIGEAKDQYSSIDTNDAETMRRVAMAFPRGRFEVYIVFAKLNVFKPDEVAVAAALSHDHNVILLTHKELEPYQIYERATEDLRRNSHSLEALVQNTRKLYPTLQPPPLIVRLAGRAAASNTDAEGSSAKGRHEC